MPQPKAASGITVSFTRDEIAWLYWIMTNVLTTPEITNTAKEKIVTAYELTHANEKRKKTESN